MQRLRDVQQQTANELWLIQTKNIIRFLMFTSLITSRLISVISKSNSCCLGGRNICICPRLALNQLPVQQCNAKIQPRQLIDHPISVYLEQPVSPGLYTIVAVAPEDTSRYNRFDIRWIVFMAINVPDTCLASNNPPCVIQPIYKPRIANCSRLTDQETQLFVFSIKQQKTFQLSEFMGETPAQKIDQIKAFGHFMEIRQFHNPTLFDGPPTHANRYRLIRCDPTNVLYMLSQIAEERDGSSVIEQYFYSPSPTYRVYSKLGTLVPFILVTERMIRRERSNCGTQRELTGYPGRVTLYPVPDVCSEKFIEKLLDDLRHDESKQKTTLKKWQKQWKKWLRFLHYQNYILLWLRSISSAKGGRRQFRYFRKHVVAEPFAKAYWIYLYRATRVTCKLQVFGELISALTGQTIDYTFY